MLDTWDAEIQLVIFSHFLNIGCKFNNARIENWIYTIIFFHDFLSI